MGPSVIFLWVMAVICIVGITVEYVKMKKEEKNAMSLDEVKPLVQMMDKLDDLREMLDNDDRLYECDFIEAISDYKEILEYRCLEAVKDACKDK